MILPVVTGFRFSTKVMRGANAFLLRDAVVPRAGYSHYFVLERNAHKVAPMEFDAPLSVLPDYLGYFDDGDVVRLDKAKGAVRVLFRRASPHNTIMVTEQCQHYCLMCSQPPKHVDDGWLL